MEDRFRRRNNRKVEKIKEYVCCAVKKMMPENIYWIEEQKIKGMWGNRKDILQLLRIDDRGAEWMQTVIENRKEKSDYDA